MSQKEEGRQRGRGKEKGRKGSERSWQTEKRRSKIKRKDKGVCVRNKGWEDAVIFL